MYKDARCKKDVYMKKIKNSIIAFILMVTSFFSTAAIFNQGCNNICQFNRVVDVKQVVCTESKESSEVCIDKDGRDINLRTIMFEFTINDSSGRNSLNHTILEIKDNKGKVTDRVHVFTRVSLIN